MAAIVPLGMMIGMLLISIIGLFFKVILPPTLFLYGGAVATMYLSIVGILKLTFEKKDDSVIDI